MSPHPQYVNSKMCRKEKETLFLLFEMLMVSLTQFHIDAFLSSRWYVRKSRLVRSDCNDERILSRSRGPMTLGL